MANVLIVDDEQSMREFLGILLSKDGHAVTTSVSVAAATKAVDEGDFELVITDLRMPDGTGLDVLKHAKAHRQELQVIIVTAYATMENAVEAMRLGAYDYQLKPFKLDEMRLVVQNALEKGHLIRENRSLKAQLRTGLDAVVGKSEPMKKVYELVEKVARAKTNIIITGESGTGKELVARAIHSRSERANAPFIAVNCGAIPDSLLESELFGYKRGAFTGAMQDKAGLFEAANGGTLFLDEVGELPLAAQVKLLRALQERMVTRVGETQPRELDVRVIAATHRDLSEEVRASRFREDLYYRLNVIPIRLPALRERREDIPLLIERFLHKFKAAGKSFHPDAMRMLLDYRFPGNVRELENIVERAVTLAEGNVLGPALLPSEVGGTTPPISVPDDGLSLEKTLEDIERRLLLDALEKSKGVKKRAAELLGLTFRSMRYRLQKLGLDAGEDEPSSP